MSLKLAFEAFGVFVRTEHLSVRVETFLVHMMRVFFVAMLFWCGNFFSQARVAQPLQTALQYRDNVIRNIRFEWGLPVPMAGFAAQLYQRGGWRPDAILPVGAQGPTQFIPATAGWVSQLVPGFNSREPFNSTWTIRVLVSYDRWPWQRVSTASDCECVTTALSGYNGGLDWV